MALPISMASKLAKEMESKGISGSISMGEPKHMGSGDAMDEHPEKEPVDELESIVKDIDEASKSPGLGHLILELCERCAAKAESEEEEPDEDSSEY